MQTCEWSLVAPEHEQGGREQDQLHDHGREVALPAAAELTCVCDSLKHGGLSQAIYDQVFETGASHYVEERGDPCLRGRPAATVLIPIPTAFIFARAVSCFTHTMYSDTLRFSLSISRTSWALAL